MKTTENLLSKLWIFLTVNYIFCDVFSLYHSKFLNDLLVGNVDGIEFTEPFLLSFAIIMEIPMLMIMLSMILKNKLNRIINMIVGVLMIVIQIGSFATGTNSLHYIFFSSIEIGTLLLILYIAWKWAAQRTFNNNSIEGI
ncbi:DUF6326 family protein [Algibacter sp. AS12]|uniref:DUF6326 family protein n=1 Tax=Algibacter sp. AS12 TaxID=3135773 RepID=UPI00398B9CDD